MKLQMSVRERVVAQVAGLAALGGFVAGATGAVLAVAILTPSAPVTIGDKVTMVFAYGVAAAISGAVLGTGLAFGILRRVRLGRVFAFGTAGAALGLTYGFLGGPWAWHHFHWLGIGGLAAGAVLARLLGREAGQRGVEGRLASWVLSRAGDPDASFALGPGAMQTVRAQPEHQREHSSRRPHRNATYDRSAAT
jgi:hypothetical protein